MTIRPGMGADLFAASVAVSIQCRWRTSAGCTAGRRKMGGQGKHVTNHMEMVMAHSTESRQDPQRSIWNELVGAGLLPVGGIAIGGFVTYAAIVLCVAGAPDAG